MADSLNQNYHSNGYTPSPSWRGYRTYYDDSFSWEKKYEEERQRFKDLITKNEMTYQENFDLRRKVTDLEIIRDNLSQELDEIENEFDMNSQRFSDRENTLLDRINFLESEKYNLENRLGYYAQGVPEEYFLNENRRLKESNLDMEIKLEILSNFFNKMQNVVGTDSNNSRNNNAKPFRLISELNVSSLREKLKVMEDNIMTAKYGHIGKTSNVDHLNKYADNTDVIDYKMKDLNYENEELR